MSRNDKGLVWITGAAGLIGSTLVKTAPAFAPGWRVRGLTRQDLDLLDFDAVRRRFQYEEPALVIHCAAQTRTPWCEANPDLARMVNVDATAALAELAADIPFIFFSTDLVFDGREGNYDETSPVNPIGVYARTKVEAEEAVQRHSRHTIVRIAINAGRSLTGDRAFNEQMRLAWQAGRTLDLFTDEYRCPMHALATCEAVWDLANQGLTGTFHIGGAEKLSRYQIGQLLATRWPQLKPRIVPGLVKNYQGAPRCPDVSLNCAKANKVLKKPLPKFSEWLVAHPNEIV